MSGVCSMISIFWTSWCANFDDMRFEWTSSHTRKTDHLLRFYFSIPTCQHKKTLTLTETCGRDQRSTVVETCTEQLTNSRNMKILDFLIIDVLLFSHCIMDISLTEHIYIVWWTTHTIWSAWSDNYSWESHRVIVTRLRHERRSPDLSRIYGPVKKSYGNSA